MKLCLLLIFLTFVHNCLSIGLYDEIDDSHLWRRGNPSVPTSPKKECIRDMLVVWDNSQSVGIGNFQDNVRPFLRKLIKNKNLNVGRDGTRIGFVTFASDRKTRNLLKIGSKTEKKDLLSWLNGLNYERDLMGDFTYTGKAFKLASEEFRLNNPLNHRKDIEDVVLLFTDGEPRARTTKWIREQFEMANKYSAELMARKVNVVALAVGREAEKPQFRKNIASWSNHMFISAFKDLDKVLGKIIAESCGKLPAVVCKCDGELSTEEYIKPGENAIMLPWKEPELKCDQTVEDKETTVEPSNTRNPQRFGRGEHTIAYTFKFKDMNGESQENVCPFKVKIGACECPRTQTVTDKVHFGQTKASVSWSEPVPTCPATAVRGNPKITRGDFSVGKHKLVYKYRHSSDFQSFYIQCDVNIVVTGDYCGRTAYDPATHICCCGKVHRKIPGNKCCGKNYYNPRNVICCQDGSLVSVEGHCPS